MFGSFNVDEVEGEEVNDPKERIIQKSLNKMSSMRNTIMNWESSRRKSDLISGRH